MKDDDNNQNKLEEPDSGLLDLETVDISDTNFEAEDKASKEAKKRAKKHAKQLRTPEEKKRQRMKQALIGLGVFALLIVTLLGVPASRWPLLNLIGFRGNLTLTLVNSETNKPIRNVAVKLEDNTLKNTDEFGRVTFDNARLGPHSVSMQKPGYGEEVAKVVNKFSSTKQTLGLKVIGIKLDFDLKNWLTGSPIEGANVAFKEEVGVSDKTGRATIVIPPTDDPSVAVQISGDGYATKTVDAQLSVESREVTLVSSQKNYFVSKRDGKFDLFSTNLDGSQQKKIVEGTGKEDGSIMQFAVHRLNKRAILVTNREGKTQNGRFVAGVYDVDLEKATLKKVDEGSDVQLFDWTDNAIAYTKTIAEAPYNDPAFTRLQTYNIASSKVTTVAQSNYFSVAQVAQTKLFFVPTDPYRDVADGSLTSYDLLSGARKSYLSGTNVRYSARASYQTLELLDVNSTSYELQIASGATKVVDRKNISSLNFAMSPNVQQAAWVDLRDGQGTVLLKNVKNNDEKVVVKVGGLTNPIRFITEDLLIARVVTSQETADYVVSVTTGKMAKVGDVSNIGSTLKPGL